MSALLSLPGSRNLSELDQMEQRLRSNGWAQKPAPMSDLDERERAMAAQLLGRKPKTTTRAGDRTEWYWFDTPFGRKWQIVMYASGIGTVDCSGYDVATLNRILRARRTGGWKVVQVDAPEQRA